MYLRRPFDFDQEKEDSACLAAAPPTGNLMPLFDNVKIRMYNYLPEGGSISADIQNGPASRSSLCFDVR